MTIYLKKFEHIVVFNSIDFRQFNCQGLSGVNVIATVLTAQEKYSGTAVCKI